MKARDWRRLHAEAFSRGWAQGAGRPPEPEVFYLDTPPPTPRPRKLPAMTDAEAAGLAAAERGSRQVAATAMASMRAAQAEELRAAVERGDPCLCLVAGCAHARRRP